MFRMGPPIHVPSKAVVVLAGEPVAYLAGVIDVAAAGAAGGVCCVVQAPIARTDAHSKMKRFIELSSLSVNEVAYSLHQSLMTALLSLRIAV